MIIYNELFVHILRFCLFIHEIDILQIWSHFIMLLKSFVIHKTLVDRVILKTINLNVLFVTHTFTKFSQFYYGL
jgi:hypothetical protein